MIGKFAVAIIACLISCCLLAGPNFPELLTALLEDSSTRLQYQYALGDAKFSRIQDWLRLARRSDVKKNEKARFFYQIYEETEPVEAWADDEQNRLITELRNTVQQVLFCSE